MPLNVIEIVGKNKPSAVFSAEGENTLVIARAVRLVAISFIVFNAIKNFPLLPGTKNRAHEARRVKLKISPHIIVRRYCFIHNLLQPFFVQVFLLVLLFVLSANFYTVPRLLFRQ